MPQGRCREEAFNASKCGYRGEVKGFRPLTGLFRVIAAFFGLRHPSPGDTDEDLVDDTLPGEPM
jgi:hypothetical protein